MFAKCLPKLWRWNRIHHKEKKCVKLDCDLAAAYKKAADVELHRNFMLIGKVANILTFLILCNDLTSIMFLCLKVLCFFKAKISLGLEVNFFLLPRHQSPQPSHKSSHEVKKGLEVCFISKKLVLDTASVDLLHPGRWQVTKQCGPPLLTVTSL